MPSEAKYAVGSLWPYAMLFLVGFPIGGALFGYAFFYVFDFLLGPLGDIGLKISVIIWAGGGAASGIYATYKFHQYDKALERLRSNDA